MDALCSEVGSCFSTSELYQGTVLAVLHLRQMIVIQNPFAASGRERDPRQLVLAMLCGNAETIDMRRLRC
jgi:hypothetical protein